MTALLSRIFPVRPSQLRQHHVLGLNARNIHFLLEWNPRSFYPVLDDKVLTKGVCESHGVPVPETLLIIERAGDLRRMLGRLGEHPEFVIKPARGAGGRGIVVVVRHDGSHFETPNGRVLSLAELRYHILTVLCGCFSLGDHADRAVVEQRVVPHPVFEKLSVAGTPDIRVIVYRSVPMMAMLRLPTHASRGRGNLHQGAVGVGIQLETGRTFGGVYRERAVTVHPETGAPMENIELPHWPAIVEMATDLSQSLGAAYIGVDIVLDAKRGPLVLEANARPGLAIQTANRCGLLYPLQQVEERKGTQLVPSYKGRLTAPVPNAP